MLQFLNYTSRFLKPSDISKKFASFLIGQTTNNTFYRLITFLPSLNEFKKAFSPVAFLYSLMRSRSFSYLISNHRMIKSLNKLIQDGVDRGLLQKFTSNDELNSSEISIDDESYVNFGSCSYLGLEYHNALKEGVKEAVDKFGTQFSTSRTYLSIGLYETLERELHRMFQKPVLVTASTTLGHLAALPVLVKEGDAVILDLQVHSSVQMTAKQLKAQKIPVHLIPHNDMESLENKIKSIKEKTNRIWYLADGVYSMYGDYAPLDKLVALMDRYPNFHVYVDDAHGMSWTGDNGVGYVRSQIEHHNQMVLITSLNKSFASGGGVIVFPNESMYQEVKNCGTTLIFSGPVQPPMLGAAIASAKLHQSDEVRQLQQELKEKIAFTNNLLDALDFPQFEKTDSPLFFIPVGLPRVIRNVIKRMKKKGFFLNSASFPAVPMKRGGIRFMINNNLSKTQIENMLNVLREEYVRALIQEGSSPAHVAKEFRIAPFMSNFNDRLDIVEKVDFLEESLHDSIEEIDENLWNQLFSRFGSNEHSNLKELEQIFSGNKEAENNWDVRYHIVRDTKGEVILASVYSLAIMKDDMLASKEISSKLIEIRKEDPMYLSSKTVITGTPFTKGKSIYINYKSDDWREAVRLHVEMLQEFAEREDASKLILRDFCSDQKNKLESHLLELGLLDMELPKNCMIRDLNWNTPEELAASLPQKYRYSLRKEILRKEENFKITYDKPQSEADKRFVYDLYRQVHRESTEISVFQLPYSLFDRMYQDDSYDFINLYIKEQPETPTAVLISQIIDGVYHAQLVGLDYRNSREYGAYKQILFQCVKRANSLGCTSIDLAYTAEMEKKKVGATPEETFGFVMAFEHYSHAEMELLK